MHVRFPDVTSLVNVGPLKLNATGSAFNADNHPPLIDNFCVIYWGCIAVIMAFSLCMLWRYEPEEFKVSNLEIDPDEEARKTTYEVNKEGSYSGAFLFAPYKAHPRELARNLWALNLITSIGQARVQKKFGFLTVSCNLSTTVVALVSITMAVCQFTALYALVHDLNPYARPVTTRPRQAWVESTWTVNTMKWFMMTYLSFNAIEEAGQSIDLMKAAYEIDARRLREPRWIIMLMGLTQYVVLCSTLLAGESAVLSFNAVPDVIYSSVAITFINSVDDVVYSVLHTVMGVEADFIVDSTEDISEDVKAHIHQIPGWLDGFFQYLVMLPMPWGLYIALHAFMTNIMPHTRFLWAVKDVVRLVQR